MMHSRHREQVCWPKQATAVTALGTPWSDPAPLPHKSVMNIPSCNNTSFILLPDMPQSWHLPSCCAADPSLPSHPTPSDLLECMSFFFLQQKAVTAQVARRHSYTETPFLPEHVPDIAPDWHLSASHSPSQQTSITRTSTCPVEVGEPQEHCLSNQLRTPLMVGFADFWPRTFPGGLLLSSKPVSLRKLYHVRPNRWRCYDTNKQIGVRMWYSVCIEPVLFCVALRDVQAQRIKQTGSLGPLQHGSFTVQHSVT